MMTLRALVHQIGSSLNRTAYDQALADELEAHIEMHMADRIREGMDPAAARRDALLKLGGLTQTLEQCRDAGTIRWLVRLSGRLS
jgi:hypothetical protein